MIPDVVAHDDIILNSADLADHTAQIQGAVDEAAAKGGSRVVLRPGRYLSGTILLRDGVTLHLEKGAVLAGSPRIQDYFRKARPPECEWIEAPAIDGGQPTALLFAENAERIALTGEGVIDGTGEAFYRKLDKPHVWAEARKPLGTWIPAFDMEVNAQGRPLALIFFIGCRDVRIESLRIQNSPRWSVHLLACTDVGIRGVSLESPIDCPNGDGIDLDACSDVVVEDCDLLTGDDAITVYNTNMWGMKRPSRNLTIRRCRLRAAPHGFVIGTTALADIENVTVDDVEIGCYGQHHAMNGIGLNMLQGAVIRNVRISNVTITGVVMPIYLRIGTQWVGDLYPAGKIEDIVFENIVIRDARGTSFMSGLADHPLRNIALRNVRVEHADIIDPADVRTKVPEFDLSDGGYGFPPGWVWRFMPAYGLFCRHIDGLELTDVVLNTVPSETRPPLLREDVREVEPRNLCP